jgi:hypothetical protein
MSEFINGDASNGLSVKLWRGEPMCLIGMDVDDPEPDLVGFLVDGLVVGEGDAIAQRLEIGATRALHLDRKQSTAIARSPSRNFAGAPGRDGDP